ncbi:MAG: PAS domain S-box protein, partial [Desulfuromonadales bacterium]|nr:PAS domain S-box protein [Desulfuromonadales bacterium]
MNIHQLLASLSLDQVLRTIPSGLFLVDLDQCIVYWNAEAERITGYSAAEAIGRHCSFLEGMPCGKGCGLFDERLPKPVIGAACTVRTRAGRKITLLKNVDYLRDASGEVVGGIESFIDLTRQSRLEKALRRQSTRLEGTVRRRTAELEAERTQLGALLDAMADFAYICAADRQIVYMNRAMIAAFGDLTGHRCYAVFYGQQAPCDDCPMEQVSAGATARQERFLSAMAGLYEVVHSPLRAPDGSLQKLAVFRDITERKETEEKLREANRELDAFVSMAAHDLRTPLSPILGYVDLLRELHGEQFNEPALDLLQEIEKQGEKMLNLLEDLLLLAQVGALPT